MNFNLTDSLQQQNMKMCRTLVYLSFVLLCSACASAIVIEQQPTREDDDRTELQKQLDFDISKNIKKRIKNTNSLKLTNLHVTTYKHVVTINGFVESAKQKSLALRLAISVSGVKTVISDIGIQK